MFELTNELIITEVPQLQKVAVELIGQEVDLELIKNYVTSQDLTVFPYNRELQYRALDSRDTVVAWVDTGYSVNGQHLFISLLREENSTMFKGYYIETLDTLINRHVQHFKLSSRQVALAVNKVKNQVGRALNSHSISEVWNNTKVEEEEEEAKVEPVKEIPKPVPKEEEKEDDNFEAILKKELPERGVSVINPLWNSLGFNPFTSKVELGRHLGRIASKILNVMKHRAKGDGFNKGYISEDEYRVAIDSGLFDHFGDTVLLIYEYGGDAWFCSGVVNSHRDLLNLGFTVSELKKEIPVFSFFEVEPKLSTNLADYDVNRNQLYHILCDHRDRFPESVQSWTNEELAIKLRSQLEQGLKICKVDPSYAKLVYSSSTDAPVWYLPFHVQTSLSEKPELVMLLRKEDFFTVATVLTIDSKVIHRIKSTSLYSRVW